MSTTQGENVSKWFNPCAEIKMERVFEGWLSNLLFNCLVYSSATGSWRAEMYLLKMYLEMYLLKLIRVATHLDFSLTGGHMPSVFDWITLYQSQHAQGLPEVIRIIISIKQMAEESNEEPLNDSHRINNVFLSFIDLSLSRQQNWFMSPALFW